MGASSPPASSHEVSTLLRFARVAYARFSRSAREISHRFGLVAIRSILPGTITPDEWA
ncbi:hypothetical protein MPL1032_220152 [Mesorhizobium plurifarium]|uniref:Uncharacterized protein n=1 Tax=Mesorhizobium plurifarium TaxID=69974 RepID=A0A0K2VZV3_MESPL|nr:hypothetical protein MPL1032_220152 [Mesorhizobium plurifarium]